MSTDGGTPITLEVLEKILFRSFFIGAALLLVVFLVVVSFQYFGYTVHHFFFDIEPEESTRLTLEWLGNFKLVLFAFFLVPWLAIRMTIKARQTPGMSN